MIKYKDIIKYPENFYIFIFSTLIFIFIIIGIIEYLWGYGNTFYELKAVIMQAMEENDSWQPMYEAAYARYEYEYEENGIYEAVFFENDLKFQYPPITLLPFIVLIKFGISLQGIIKIAYVVSFLAMLGIAFCGYRIAISILEKYPEKSVTSKKQKIGIFAVSFFGIFSFHPIYIGQYIGQIQVMVDFLIGLAFMFWLVDRKQLSGAAIALAALIKPQLALILLWAVLRKQKDCLVGMLIVFVPAGIISLVIFGFQEHVDYLKVLAHIGKHGETFWPNQSINGLLNRLFGEGSSVQFRHKAYAGYNEVVYLGTLISSVIFILFGLFYNKPNYRNFSNQTIISALDLGTMTLLLTIATPVAWTHHYGVLWPVFVLGIMVAIMCRHGRRNPTAVKSLILLCMSYFLISNYFSFADNAEYGEPPLNLLQSYFLYGGFVLLAGLLLLRKAFSDSSTSELSNVVVGKRIGV